MEGIANEQEIYKRIEFLGRGTSGNVYLVQEIETS